MPSVKRIGITMRVVETHDYQEARDALAHDWTVFMAKVLPDVDWLPLPNLGEGIGNFLESFKINGFILSGGNDLGSAPSRDMTEGKILEFAAVKGLPVLGVCRGLQFINVQAGGALSACPQGQHVSTRHDIVLADRDEEKVEVNSYHNMGIRPDDVGSGLEPFASTADGSWVEGLRNEEKNTAGVMWHPEREIAPRPHDVHIFHHLFK